MADDLKPESLYERDFVAWTESQAAALRARRQGLNALDYDHLAEEIEDLGKSDVRACQSHVDLIIEHLMKIEFLGGQDVPHWRGEIGSFRRKLARTLTPTIKHRVQGELSDSHSEAVRQLVNRELLTAPEVIEAARARAYKWEEIVDPDWYPEPRA